MIPFRPGAGAYGKRSKIPIHVFIIGGNGNHCCIVGTIFKSRDVSIPLLVFTKLFKSFTQTAVGRNPTGYAKVLDTGLKGCLLQFLQQDGNNAVLYGGTDISQVLVYKFRVLSFLFLE